MQASGEGGNGATQTTAYNATNLFLGTILDPSIDVRDDDGGGATGFADATAGGAGFMLEKSATLRPSERTPGVVQ